MRDKQLELLSMERTGRGHWRATIKDDKGKTLTYIVASTPSDSRAARNRDKDITRFFNN